MLNPSHHNETSETMSNDILPIGAEIVIPETGDSFGLHKGRTATITGRNWFGDTVQSYGVDIRDRPFTWIHTVVPADRV